MSHEYARNRVRDALEESGGDYMEAQNLLLSWLEHDVELLLSLAGPHLPSLISYAIGHELADEKAREETENRKAMPGKIIKGKGAPARKKKSAVDEDTLNEFGKSLLTSLKDGPRFGEEQPPGSVSRPGKASQQHVDAMKKLAAASIAKGRDKKKNKKKDD